MTTKRRNPPGVASQRVSQKKTEDDCIMSEQAYSVKAIPPKLQEMTTLAQTGLSLTQDVGELHELLSRLELIVKGLLAIQKSLYGLAGDNMPNLADQVAFWGSWAKANGCKPKVALKGVKTYLGLCGVRMSDPDIVRMMMRDES